MGILNVEPVILLQATAMGLYLMDTPAFLYWKICMHQYQYDTQFDNSTMQLNNYCQNLEVIAQNAANGSSVRADEVFVQQQSARYSLYSSLCTALPAAFLSILCGAWSDRFGRKPLLIISLAGTTLAYIPTICAAAYPYTTPSWFLFGSVVIGLTGGPLVFFTAAFSMVTDEARKKDDKYLHIRLGIASGMLLGGFFLGSIAFSVMSIVNTSHAAIFMVADIFNTIALLYTAFFARETVHLSRQGVVAPEQVLHEQEQACCNLHQIKDSLMTLAKPRTDKRRFLLLMSLLAYNLVYACDMGMPGLTFLFLRHPPLDWKQSQYGIMMTVMTGIGALGQIFMPIIFSLCQTPDIILGIIGLTVLIIKGFAFGLAKNSIIIYLYAAATVISASFYPSMKTYISQLVDRDEIGKIFAAISCAENLAPIVAGIFFSNMYAFTVQFFDGLVFIIASAVEALCCAVFIFLFFVDPRRKSWDNDMEPVIDVSDNNGGDY